MTREEKESEAQKIASRWVYGYYIGMTQREQVKDLAEEIMELVDGIAVNNKKICQNCDKNEALEEHTCAFLEEQEHDINYTCTCCKACWNDCVRGI